MIAVEKHDKATPDLNYNRLIYMIGNIVNSAFTGKAIGSFVNTQPKPFSDRFSGIFKCARGSSKLGESFAYEAGEPLSPEIPYACDLKRGLAVCLAPLAYWGVGWDRLQNQPDLYLFDGWNSDRSAVFKAVEEAQEITIDEIGKWSGVYNMLRELQNGDKSGRKIEKLEFSPRMQTTEV